MKYEIITLHDVRVIGMSREIAFNNPSREVWLRFNSSSPSSIQNGSPPIRNSAGRTTPAAWSGIAAPISIPLTTSAA